MRTVLDRAQAEVFEKKSRFIGVILPVQSYGQVQEALARLKKEYRDARHYCFGVRLEKDEEGRASERASDDGEPQGTAGRPILSVLRGEGLSDVLLVVIRYFGGTLLGTGGLVRAYTEAARAAIAQAVQDGGVVTYSDGFRYRTDIEYTILGKFQAELGETGIYIEKIEYSDVVSLYTIVDRADNERFLRMAKEITLGRSVPHMLQEVMYRQQGGELFWEETKGQS